MNEDVCQVCGRKPKPGEVLLSTIVCDPGGARRICGTHLTCVLNQT